MPMTIVLPLLSVKIEALTKKQRRATSGAPLSIKQIDDVSSARH
jgi:hypothetical protein